MNKFVLVGKYYNFNRGFTVKFAFYSVFVGFYRITVDIQFVCYFFAGVSVGQQLDYFEFPIRQFIRFPFFHIFFTSECLDDVIVRDCIAKVEPFSLYDTCMAQIRSSACVSLAKYPLSCIFSDWMI